MTPPSRAELVEHLVRTGIAGQVNTPRQNNLKHYRRLVDGDEYYQFGLTFAQDWSFDDVLALMSKRCGVVADPGYEWGIDTIDPDRTADALEAVADRLAEAAAGRERVLFATGHPRNLLETYQRWGAALAERGCAVVTAAEGHTYEVESEYPPSRRVLVWRDGVGMVTDGVDSRHSHHPFAMRAVLAELREAGEAWPQLVIADHGFAGAAGEAGIPTLGFADSNDPALFLAEHEGKLHATVPLDDGYTTDDYRPLADYVLDRAGLT
ncbi:phosphatase [Marinitenerispora sediminis]|uniref:Phosphatase n=1 Tax=Marinitenerispora sediminis TaxID=1931232 RepID=A0A368T1A0_9ACTN|nr:phosphatase [Marinitenerispora sediminis]RCV49978.1 phosphatase [Marinitenerispora sediminis]RCV50212.1 phosphatase [Marinitenerispora sediminis]RCV53426.1 phosphatase [Marinitenerispora sediminis]